MASLADLEAGLIKADAAGNADDARLFAAEIRRMRDVPRGTTGRGAGADWSRTGAGGDFSARVPQELLEFGSGATDVIRGALNQARPGLGDRVLPPTPGDSGWEMAGRMADPASWLIAGGVGKVLPFVPLLAKGAKGIPRQLAKNVTAGAVPGGIIGALSDTGEAGTGATFGATAGAVLPPVVGGVSRVANKIWEHIKPTPGGIGVKAAGDKADDVINTMRLTRSATPGVKLTAGQAATPAGSAEFSALQEAVSKSDPSRYLRIEGEQEGARGWAMRGVARNPTELRVAQKTRSDTAETNYGAAYKQAIKADPELAVMGSTPYFKRAW